MLSHIIGEEYLILGPSASLSFVLPQILNCCGVNKPYDWEGILEIPNNYTNTISTETTLVVPDSCCSIVNKNNECTEFFSNGCYQRMNFIISQSTMLIATGATAVAFVQILGVICAFMLARTIRRTKSIRLARRWQLQQGLGIVNTSVNFPRTPRLNDYTQLGKVVETNNNKNNVEPITYSANSPTNM